MKNSKSIFLISRLVLAILVCLSPIGLGKSIANAQNLRPEAVAAIIYQNIPSFPQENQYISQETGEVDLDNTLISRFIRYHEYVKNRPTKYRLDWKLTLADYLRVNEPIRDFRYPGSSTLQVNPLEGDRAAINRLSRRQRNDLVDTLISLYGGKQRNNSTSDFSPSLNKPDSHNSNPLPKLPQAGDAELLLP